MIWLIGSNGMLGSCFVRLLRQEKYDFVATGREVDVTSELAVNNFVKLHQPKIIINCSAYTQVDDAETNFVSCYQLNSFVPQLLGQVAKRNGIKVLHISTDYVFDGKSSKPYKESFQTNPINVYGKTKLEGERLLERSGADFWIFRTSWLFGKGKRNFVTAILDQINSREEILAVDDSFGCPTYTQDLAEACVTLISHTSFGKYHFCNSNQVSWYQFAVEIFNQAKVINPSSIAKKVTPVSSAQFSRAALRPKYSVLDTSRISQILNYNPRSYQDALKDYLKEELNETTK